MLFLNSKAYKFDKNTKQLKTYIILLGKHTQNTYYLNIQKFTNSNMLFKSKIKMHKINNIRKLTKLKKNNIYILKYKQIYNTIKQLKMIKP